MSSEAKNTKKKVILVIDDQKEILDALSEMVTSWGYSCVTSSSLNDAITKASNQKFNLILLDIMLEKQISFKILELMRRNKSHINFFTPVILISGSIESEVFDTYAGHFNDAIVKPPSPDLIKEKLDKWSDRNHFTKFYRNSYVHEYLIKKIQRNSRKSS